MLHNRVSRECQARRRENPVNNNAALDTFAKSLQKLVEDLNIKEPFDIIRLYSMDSEVAAQMVSKKGKKT